MVLVVVCVCVCVCVRACVFMLVCLCVTCVCVCVGARARVSAHSEKGKKQTNEHAHQSSRSTRCWLALVGIALQRSGIVGAGQRVQRQLGHHLAPRSSDDHLTGSRAPQVVNVHVIERTRTHIPPAALGLE